jgi:ABC-type branched-subunit amino acid transport system substrate-binding protein
MSHTYYRKYPAQDKRGYAVAFINQYQQLYKEDFAQPGVTAYDPTLMFARAMEIANNGSDAYAIRAACPKALEEGKLPLIFPNNDVLKNGLIVGSPELLLQVKGGGYTQVEEMKVQRNLLE